MPPPHPNPYYPYPPDPRSFLNPYFYPCPLPPPPPRPLMGPYADWPRPPTEAPHLANTPRRRAPRGRSPGFNARTTPPTSNVPRIPPLLPRATATTAPASKASTKPRLPDRTPTSNAPPTPAPFPSTIPSDPPDLTPPSEVTQTLASLLEAQHHLDTLTSIPPDQTTTRVLDLVSSFLPYDSSEDTKNQLVEATQVYVIGCYSTLSHYYGSQVDSLVSRLKRQDCPYPTTIWLNGLKLIASKSNIALDSHTLATVKRMITPHFWKNKGDAVDQRSRTPHGIPDPDVPVPTAPPPPSHETESPDERYSLEVQTDPLSPPLYSPTHSPDPSTTWESALRAEPPVVSMSPPDLFPGPTNRVVDPHDPGSAGPLTPAAVGPAPNDPRPLVPRHAPLRAADPHPKTSGVTIAPPLPQTPAPASKPTPRITPCRNIHLGGPNADKDRWTLTPRRPILILGSSNLKWLPIFLDDRVQVDVYPGASVRHANHILSKLLLTYPHVRQVILYFGLNDRSSFKLALFTAAIRRLRQLASRRFPGASILFPLIQYSRALPATEQENLRQINSVLERYPHIPALPPGDLVTHADNVHWKLATGEKIWDLWKKSLTPLST